MKRQEHLAEVEEVATRVRVENLKRGRYLGTSPDVPGLVRVLIGRLEGFSYREVVQKRRGFGFQFDRQGPAATKFDTTGDMAEGTLRAILREAGINANDSLKA